MKNFKDNLDEESMSEQKNPYESPRAEGDRTFGQKLMKGLLRYGLLIIVGLAALSITFLHFKGRYILDVLRGTPLPTFFLEKIIAPKALPDKTKVYEQALKEEEKERRRKVSMGSKLIKPHWQVSPVHGTSKTIAQVDAQDTIVKSNEVFGPPEVDKDTVKLAKQMLIKPPKRVKKKPKLNKSASTAQKVTEKKETVVDFFQPVKTGSAWQGAHFFSCVVHGGQEVSNNQMLTLRLTEDLNINDQKIPSGTLVYGVVRLAQNRVEVSVSRIQQQAVQYRVHDHTYHEGILLDENLNVWEDAARETAYRQGQRSVRELPFDVATELGRSVLQRSKRKQSTIFMPDGYPLYLVNQQKSTP